MNEFEKMIESNIVKPGGKKRNKKKIKTKKSKTSTCDRLLRFLDLKESQWYDDDYDVDKDW